MNWPATPASTILRFPDRHRQRRRCIEALSRNGHADADLGLLGNDGSVAYKHVGQLDEQVVHAAMTSLAPDLALP